MRQYPYHNQQQVAYCLLRPILSREFNLLPNTSTCDAIIFNYKSMSYENSTFWGIFYTAEVQYAM
jgi:hypothetical protein